eukprot:3847163-Amphidinium_carterae.4
MMMDMLQNLLRCCSELSGSVDQTLIAKCREIISLLEGLIACTWVSVVAIGSVKGEHEDGVVDVASTRYLVLHTLLTLKTIPV